MYLVISKNLEHLKELFEYITNNNNVYCTSKFDKKEYGSCQEIIYVYDINKENRSLKSLIFNLNNCFVNKIMLLPYDVSEKDDKYITFNEYYFIKYNVNYIKSYFENKKIIY